MTQSYEFQIFSTSSIGGTDLQSTIPGDVGRRMIGLAKVSLAPAVRHRRQDATPPSAGRGEVHGICRNMSSTEPQTNATMSNMLVLRKELTFNRRWATGLLTRDNKL